MLELIEKLAQKSPIAVMGRALLENIFAPQKIDKIFREHRVAQRERDWLFSSIVALMTVVSCKIKPSICAAYAAIKDSAPATLDALYKKLDGRDRVSGIAGVAFGRDTDVVLSAGGVIRVIDGVCCV